MKLFNILILILPLTFFAEEITYKEGDSFESVRSHSVVLYAYQADARRVNNALQFSFNAQEFMKYAAVDSRDIYKVRRGDAFVLTNGETDIAAQFGFCDPALIALGDMAEPNGSYPTPMHMNGNDAIVLANNETTAGIGSGQPSRLDSCKIAVEKMNKFQNIKESDEIVAASDAFFPFVDGIETLIQSGVSAVIQPSGSIRDKEIIKFANQTNTILVFSKTRHFKH